MIRILRGKLQPVRAECIQRLQQADCGVWIEETQPPRSWIAVRRLVSRLWTHLGDDKVEVALDQSPLISALLFAERRAKLTPEQLDDFQQLIARPTSHLTHNWFLDRPVMHGVAALMANLFRVADRPVTLVIPDLAAAHPTTIALIVILFRRFPAVLPEVLVGYDPEASTHFVDDHGLAWGATPEMTQDFVRAMKTVGGVEVLDITDAGQPEVEEPDLTFAPCPCDDDLDGRAFHKVAASNGPLQEEDARLLIDAMERAFEVFSRDIALRLGLALLDTGTALKPQRRARLHGLLGLSGHNWQFETTAGNPRLTDFLESHFQEALDLEAEPVYRLAILYRLAVTVGRRRKAFAEAMEFADRAIEEAVTAGVSRADSLYYGIWARNIRAYLHMRLRDLPAAFEDSNTGLEMVDELIRLRNNRDSRFTRTTLADNNLTLCKISGDEELLLERVQKNIQLLEADPESFGGRFSAGAWVQIFRERYQLKAAIRCAQFGLADAADEYLQFRWYYLSQLADLQYRLGRADLALEMFDQTLDLRDHFRSLQGRLFLSPALAAFRAGEIDAAREQLQAALEHPEATDSLLQAEILAQLAELEATAGLSERADETINRAIELAVDSGVRDAMVRIAHKAGDVACLLERHDEAVLAYRRGLEIAQIEGEDPPPVGAVSGLLLGLLRLGADEPEALESVIELAPRALHEDPDTWWRLPVLLEYLTLALNNGLQASAPDLETSLAAIITAASQRADCQQWMERLRQRLPESVHYYDVIV